MTLSESSRNSVSPNVPSRVTTHRPLRTPPVAAVILGLLSIPVLIAGCGTSGGNSTAAVPTFTPAAGKFNSAQTVTIGDATPGAVLHCTTDGTAPTASSPVCSEPTTVSRTETLSAIAVEPGGTPSAVATAAYEIDLPQAATPAFSTPAGTYVSAQTVSVTDTTSGANIYYTLDGTTPSASSTLFNPSAPITVSGDVPATVTINAIAIASGYADSAIVTETLKITPPAVAPTITPTGGSFAGAQTGVTISDQTPGAMIYYAFTAGTGSPNTVTSSATLYNANTPITVPATGTISAIAIAPGYSQGAQTDATFNLSAVAPVISPLGGNFTTIPSVTFADSTAGANIYYTVTPNGSTPVPLIPNTPGVSYYNGTPIPVTASETIAALAVASGFSNSAASNAQFTVTLPPAATPVISLATGPAPATGTYNAVQTLTISDTTSGSAIYYTTDGTAPSATHGTPYNGPITVASSETVTAIAIAYGYNNSSTATAQFSLVAPTPVLSVATGTYTTPEVVSISNSNATAQIFYTVDGSAPTTASSVFTQSFTVGQNFLAGQSETVRALAHVTGFADSAIATSILTFNLPLTPTPGISPAGGAFASSAEPKVTLSAVAGATIYYTVTSGTVGTQPTTSSLAYGSTGPFTVTQNDVVEAIAVLPGDAPSNTATAAFTINQNAANPPMFSVAAGQYNAAQMVTISDTTPNAMIYYAVGAAPTAIPADLYTPGTVIDVTKSETVYAIATATGFNQSSAASAAYTITQPSAGTLTFSVASGTVLNSSSPAITITGAAAGATIYYTTDGTTPTASSTPYTNAGIAVAAPETIKAIAIESGYTSSDIASATYGFQIATPVISPNGGTFTTATKAITISDATSGATIYYTVSTTGTTPTAASTLYTVPFTISASDVVEAIAISTAAGYTNSSVAAATFTQNISSGPTLSGTVISGTKPVLGATVQLYAAGTAGYASAPSAITGATATSDATTGAFSLPYTCPAAPGDLMYVVATGGSISSTGPANTGIGLITALGPCASLPTTSITVNEVTTIASVYALSGFAAPPTSSGGINIGAPAPTTACAAANIGNSQCNYPGLLNAFATVNNLVDISAGTARTITPAYAAHPVALLNTSTVPQARINTLADILSTCVQSSAGCTTLFGDVGGAVPADTLQAALDIALNPGVNVPTLFALLPTAPPYTPTLAAPGGTATADTTAPGDWTLAITYTGAGLGVDNNLDSFDNVEGYSIALDTLGDVWVAALAPNSGSGGSANGQLSGSGDALSGMIAGFNNLGAPLTPATVYDPASAAVTSFGGYGPAGIGSNTFAGISPIDAGASAIATDAANNVWVIASGGTVISKVAIDLGSATSPLKLVNFPADSGTGGQISVSSGAGTGANSFAFDTSGDLWVSTVGYNAPIYDYNTADGTLRNQFPSNSNTTGLFDLTFDSAGGLWGGDVNDQDTQLYNLNSGALVATVGNTSGFYLVAGKSGKIYTCDANAGYDVFTATSTTPVNYNVNGGCGPFAVDGAENIWSINGSSLSEVSADGNLVTPAAGYSATSAAESPTVLQVNTNPATVIDGSGNLWLLNSNNYSTDGTTEGNTLVEFVGVATPTISNLAVATANGAQGTKP